jgi:hypothetical protein
MTMIGSIYPETYPALRELYATFLDSDEFLEYNEARDNGEKQAVIDKYRFSPAQIRIIERLNMIIDIIASYDGLLGSGATVDLPNHQLSAAETELVKTEVVEETAAEALYRFSKDSNSEHIREFFRMFPDAKELTIRGQTIKPSDVK